MNYWKPVALVAIGRIGLVDPEFRSSAQAQACQQPTQHAVRALDSLRRGRALRSIAPEHQTAKAAGVIARGRRDRQRDPRDGERLSTSLIS